MSRSPTTTPLNGQLAIPKFDCTRRKGTADGGTIKCLHCTAQFNNKFKAITHYTIVHKLFPCIICSALFATDLDRITHENCTHWPYTCVRCPAKFLNPIYLEVHLRDAHHMTACHLCAAAVHSNADIAVHLQEKHAVVNRSNNNTAFFELIERDAETAALAKFRCLLCDKTKPLSWMLTHCQDGHKVDFNKLLNFMLTLSGENLQKIGGSLTEAKSVQKRTLLTSDSIDDAIKRIAGSAVNRVTNSACQFTMVPKEDVAETKSSIVPLRNYDTNIVHCIASTDEGSDDEMAETTALQACEYCNLTFPSVRELCVHMKKSHGFQVVDENRCRTCHNKYASRSSLLKHRGSMHSRRKMTVKKLFQCPACDQNCENYSRRQLR